MSLTRKFIVSVATSADGYIARPDGGVEWLDRERPAGDYGMGTFWRSVDTIVMGRKTYDFALAHGGAKLYGGKDVFVFTRQQLPADPSVTFVSGGAAEFARSLRARKGKDIWLMGGGELIASFLDDGAIDEFVVAVIPVMIGEGIPLIAPRHRLVPLSLLESESFEDGVVRLRYAVTPARAPSPPPSRPRRKR